MDCTNFALPCCATLQRIIFSQFPKLYCDGSYGGHRDLNVEATVQIGVQFDLKMENYITSSFLLWNTKEDILDNVANQKAFHEKMSTEV